MTERDDQRWHRMVMGDDPRFRAGRRLFGRLPAHVRCKNCSSPLDGWAGAVMRRLGRGPYPRNPRFCGY